MRSWIALVCMGLSAGGALAGPEAEISAYRKAHGLSAVTVDAKLMALAARQAQAMASRGVLEHDAYASFQSRIASWRPSVAVENIAMGTTSFAATLAVWKASSAHNANLLSRPARRVGIASASGHGRLYWALILAAPDVKPPQPRRDRGFLQVAR
jgi:uncharacterized protein YkwD